MRVQLIKEISFDEYRDHLEFCKRMDVRSQLLIRALAGQLAEYFMEHIEKCYTKEECRHTGKVIFMCDMTLTSLAEEEMIYKSAKYLATRQAENALVKSKAVMDDYGYLVISDEVRNDIKSEFRSL